MLGRIALADRCDGPAAGTTWPQRSSPWGVPAGAPVPVRQGASQCQPQCQRSLHWLACGERLPGSVSATRWVRLRSSMSTYVTPPPQPSDEPARPWDHSAFAEDSYHEHRPVANPQEFLRSLEVEGYAVWPRVLPPPLLQRLQRQISTYATNPRDYSSRQRGVALAGPVPFIDERLQTHGKPNALAELIGLPETVNKLAQIFGGGSPPVFVSFAYDISCVGTPGISLHTDMQPYGSTLFGGSLFSSPQLVRVLYYLDDLTLDVSPFRCIPRSREAAHVTLGAGLLGCGAQCSQDWASY